MINTNESDVRAGAPTAVFVTRGVVGWATSSTSTDVGSATSRDVTLVMVTLESGRVVNSSKPPQAGKADGQEILCQVGGPLYAIPPKGTAVLIAFPDGMSDVPGAGVILLWLGAELKMGSARFIAQSDGSTSMVTSSDGTDTGKLMKRSLSKDPYQGCVDSTIWGYAKLNVTGYHLMTSAGARMDGGGISGPGMVGIGSYWTFSAASCSLQASTVNLGPTRGTQIPVVLSTPLMVYLSALEVAIGTINATVFGTAAMATMNSSPPVAAAKIALISTCTNSN